MCGLVGYLNASNEPASERLVQKMTAAIVHRGPDAEGSFVAKNLALGHRRLSIIDLSEAGTQPMTSSDGRFTIAYNGEVYNFKNIKEELKHAGYKFRSDTDTEVVLNAFSYWGISCFARFNGMFACAIYDEKQQELTLARDRYGIKPLYLGFSKKRFYFCSEIKGILADPSFEPAVCSIGMQQYFTFQNFFDHGTLFQNSVMFPAGSHAVIQIGDNFPRKLDELKTTQFWDFKFSRATNLKSQNEASEELQFLFRQAVNRQLVSDVPVNCYLSGGMDSGSITAIASESVERLRTFTCGFDLTSASGLELAFDERAAAEKISYEFGTEQYEMVLKSGDMERVMSEYVWAIENPMVGQSYMNYYIAHLASKFGKVVLAGTGGDELFGGYPWRYFYGSEGNKTPSYPDEYFNYWQRLVPSEQIGCLLRPAIEKSEAFDGKETFANVIFKHDSSPSTGESFFNNSLYLECKTFMHGLLTIEDKVSMAHSLETRVPFLDNDLVDFACTVPATHKVSFLQKHEAVDENLAGKRIYSEQKRTNDGKQVLRAALSNILPNEITSGVKQGFSAPDASWAKGDSIDFVRDRLCNKSNKIYDFLDYDTSQQLLEDHFSGATNRRLFVWSMIFVDEWQKLFFEKR